MLHECVAANREELIRAATPTVEVVGAATNARRNWNVESRASRIGRGCAAEP
jgi:hypothetical protein